MDERVVINNNTNKDTDIDRTLNAPLDGIVERR
jgi:hypothetical protein